MKTLARDVAVLYARNPFGKGNLLGGRVICKFPAKRFGFVPVNPRRKGRAIDGCVFRDHRACFAGDGLRIPDLFYRRGLRPVDWNGTLIGAEQTRKIRLYRHGRSPNF